MSVAIVLATFNGARFLPDFLASLSQQSHTDWQLLVRDDGSTDATVALLQAFQAQQQQPVRLIADDLGRLGASGNFAQLLSQVDADYILLADQDDIWLPHKIASMLAAASHSEADARTTPRLWHGDMQLIDADNRLLAASFWRYQGIDAQAGQRFKRLLVENSVTGCATMINRALLQSALPIPPNAIMHDWWLALVASALGQIDIIEQATVQYRQHADNAVGAKAGRVGNLMQQLGQHGLAPARASIMRKRAQAASFAAHFAGVTNAQPAVALSLAWVHAAQHSKLQRIASATRLGLRMSTLGRTLGLYLAL